MNIKIILLIVIACAALAAYTVFSNNGASAKSDNNPVRPAYDTISGADAKKLMDSETDYIILDVREKNEYKAGHIPKAMLIPLGELKNTAISKLPDKQELILVYCRSGNRSGQAAALLAEMGYTNVKNFGGIMNWKYDIVTE